MLLLPQLGVSTSPCGLLDDSFCSTSDTLASHRHWRIPKVHTARSYTNTYTKSLQSSDCVLFPVLLQRPAQVSVGTKSEQLWITCNSSIFSGKDVIKTLSLSACNYCLGLSSRGTFSQCSMLFSCIFSALKAQYSITFGQVHPLLLYLGSKETQLQIPKLRIPSFICLQLVQRINSIYCTKRGKKRLKKLSMSNVETTSLRGKGSPYSLYPLAR